MLSPGTSPSQLSMANPRQISLYGYAGVVYTVPANRKFVGYIYNTGNAAVHQVTPAGGTPVTQNGGTLAIAYQSTTPYQVVLVAGTIITGSNAAIQILGVESDL